MGSLWQDVRYGIRGFRKDIGVFLVATFALALGIGATTTIFSVIYNMLIEPFPYAQSDRLTQFLVHDQSSGQPFGRGMYTMPEFHAFKEQNHVLEGLIATSNMDVLYTTAEGTKLFAGGKTSTDAFDFLGIKPELGRAFVASDGMNGAPPVVVLSHKTWREQFNGDPKLIGQTLKLNGEYRTVIGVMPDRCRFGALDMWLPLDYSSNDTDPFHRAWLLGRRKPGVSLKMVASDLDPIARRMAATYPKDYPEKFTLQVATLADTVVGQFRTMLLGLLAAVGMLLLIACSNVANLLLTRATAREREIAIRVCLGSKPGRIVRQLLVESALLAGAGCVLGCLLAYAATKGIVVAVPDGFIPAEAVITLNVKVLLFAVAVSFFTALLCGLAPALHATRKDVFTPMKGSGKGVNAGSAHGKLRSALVIAQVALSIVLLVGAGLMMRSLFAVRHVALGIDPRNILVARTPLPKGRYDTAEQKRFFYGQVLQKISALPGVVAATEASALPVYGGINSELTVPGKAQKQKSEAMFQLCSEGVFRTLQVRLLRGRLLAERDVDSGRHVAVVNQALAHKFFAGEDPIGRSVKFNLLDTIPDAPHDTFFEIIGVVDDVKNRGLQEPALPEAYLPYTITGAFERGVLVRTAVPPLSLLEKVRREIWSVDSGVALTFTGTMEEYLSRFSYSQPRFGVILFGSFAAIGLVLVAIGIFSVMSYTVGMRTHEIGIRMALGAQRSNVLSMILGKGLLITSIGVAIGVLASGVFARFLQSQIWGVSSRDPVTLASVLALVVLVSASACYVPARHATKVDPMVALRNE